MAVSKTKTKPVKQEVKNQDVKKQSSKIPDGRKFSIVGIVFAVLSLIVLPIVFGPLAVIFGIIGVLKKDTKLGVLAIVLGVVLAVISTIIAYYFLFG